MSRVTHWGGGGLAVGIGRGGSHAIGNTGFSLGATDVYVHGQLGVNSSAYFDGTVTVGLSGTGYDVTLHGNTAGAKAFWDASADQFELVGGAALMIEKVTSLSGGERGKIVNYLKGDNTYKLYFYSKNSWEQITSA